MRAIIIGAGRGSRLQALTDDQPKCYAPVGGRRILDWVLEAFHGAGLNHVSTTFIGGYRIDQIRRDYPQLTICHNVNWPKNNILASLFYAEPYMTDGFICSYADILFRNTVVKRALDHPADIVLCVDTRWRDRYGERSQHPEDDAEKVIAEDCQVKRIHRHIAAEEADGEYIGVAKFTATGAAMLREYYSRARERYTAKPWREAIVFEKAYLIDLFQEMIEDGITFHMVTTKGEYMEIDTEEDYVLANRDWVRRLPGYSS